MDRREELLRAEAEGWEELIALVHRAAPERLERPDLNAEGWSVKDLLWHVAFWCGDAERALGKIRDGTFDAASEPEGPEEVDAINAEQLGRGRARTLQEVRDEMHRARVGMLERFGELPEVTAEADEWLDESGPRHYAEHLPALRAWLTGA
jgi:hypothetical protein